MNFTRLNYDLDTYHHNLKQSTGSSDYMLGTPMPNCKDCLSPNPNIRQNLSGVSTCADRALIDVDSEMIGIMRRATNCPNGKYFPNQPTAFCSQQRVPSECDAGLSPEDTRLSNPPCTLRGTNNGFNRWEWTCQDPQSRVSIPFDVLISERTLAKDNHRPCVPNPIDQTLALPPHSDDDRVLSMPSASCGVVVNNVPATHWRKCTEVSQY